ncbi:enoyl-CoA hydratase/isomerase family protein [Acuticoccus sp. I52.16.1]|uniref:enoyl-CoA hydratase/isomerase family protein n=1 Tax=Acuticoccus sp. I52.16.1 TaxID=2928472 RepID=UPI001FD2393A|nr:enoyl-CoA hydratase-related protein [Acuticoccus sp. I52.16.1]UOM34935.1 enoyl-CoA hydratase-related protein [Acuticoccus sp. I52.16.1]
MSDEMPHVDVSRDGAVATATLVNPARRNAISLGMWRELEDFAVSVSADPDVRAVVFRGRGEVFSAGADITGFADDRSDATNARVYDDQLELSCRAIEAIRQPTVARLEGPVVGAGAALALSCDIRVATEDAFFMVPAARLGLGYDPRGVARLIRMFGESMARWVMLTAGRLPVQRAFVMGAVHEVLSDEDIDEGLERLVARLAENAPLSLAAAKVSVRAVADGTEPTLMEEAWRLVDAADASDDYVEGRAAFAEKRTPHFEGR